MCAHREKYKQFAVPGTHILNVDYQEVLLSRRFILGADRLFYRILLPPRIVFSSRILPPGTVLFLIFFRGE